MERDLRKRISRALRRAPRRRPRNAVYFDDEILALLLWAALHGRPVSWACRRSSWPMQAWRRRLPDQSTMSRRVRRPEIGVLLRRVLCLVQLDASAASTTLIVDGKALELPDHTRDPEARSGRGVCGYDKGYKLHALIDDRWRVLAWRVSPLNEAECVVAQGLLRDGSRWSRPLLRPHGWVLGDGSYDSNRLHLRAATYGLQLIAPRRRPDRAMAISRKHHRSRHRSVAITEGDDAEPRSVRNASAWTRSSIWSMRCGWCSRIEAPRHVLGALRGSDRASSPMTWRCPVFDVFRRTG